MSRYEREFTRMFADLEKQIAKADQRLQAGQWESAVAFAFRRLAQNFLCGVREIQSFVSGLAATEEGGRTSTVLTAVALLAGAALGDLAVVLLGAWTSDGRVSASGAGSGSASAPCSPVWVCGSSCGA